MVITMTKSEILTRLMAAYIARGGDFSPPMVILEMEKLTDEILKRSKSKRKPREKKDDKRNIDED